MAHTHDREFAELARAVASHLDGFTAHAVDDFGYTLRLDHPDGRGLYLHRQHNNECRVEIVGAYPHSDYYFREGEHVSITVAITRGPAVISREITRRLLPVYTQVLGKIHAHIAKQTTDHANRTRAARRLAALIPDASIHDDGHHATTVRWYTADEPIGYGHIELSAAGTTGSFQARNLPIAAVEQLASTLCRLRGRRPDRLAVEEVMPPRRRPSI
jgi:hypothetical protein